MTDWLGLHGRPEPPEATHRLTAGDTELLLDGIDLRYLKAGGVEAVRRLHVAVRDRNWMTIPARVEDLQIHRRDGGFRVAFDARHLAGPIDFTWSGEIVGEPDGAVTYYMRGRALGSFEYNRIGFCVLHPADKMRGARYQGRTAGGEVSGHLPDWIAPQSFAQGRCEALFEPVTELTIELDGGGEVRTDFTGDEFETEDQRNWSDASHKTYSTPLALGYPHRAVPGQSIEQSVRVTVASGSEVRARPVDGRPTVRVGAGAGVTMPEIGFGAGTDGEPLTPSQVGRLRALAPAHLRVDLRLGDPDADDVLDDAVGKAGRFGCGLELAVHLLESQAAELLALARRLEGVPLRRVLVFAADAASPGPRETTPPGLVALVRAALGGREVPVGGGTDMYFCELNRTRPEAEPLDVIAWSLNPQVHAFDERSIMETLLTHAEIVRSARRFTEGRPLAVTPITLRPRYNPNATADEEVPQGSAPSWVDPRQPTAFAAGWTLGCLAEHARAQVGSVTLYELTGRGGLMAADDAYVVLELLEEVAGLRGAEVVETSVSAPLDVAALGLRTAVGHCVLVANLAAQPQSLALHGLGRGTGSVRRLGEVGPKAAHVPEEGLELDLEPYGLLRLDTETL